MVSINMPPQERKAGTNEKLLPRKLLTRARSDPTVTSTSSTFRKKSTSPLFWVSPISPVLKIASHSSRDSKQQNSPVSSQQPNYLDEIKTIETTSLTLEQSQTSHQDEHEIQSVVLPAPDPPGQVSNKNIATQSFTSKEHNEHPENDEYDIETGLITKNGHSEDPGTFPSTLVVPKDQSTKLSQLITLPTINSDDFKSTKNKSKDDDCHESQDKDDSFVEAMSRDRSDDKHVLPGTVSSKYLEPKDKKAKPFQVVPLPTIQSLNDDEFTSASKGDERHEMSARDNSFVEAVLVSPSNDQAPTTGIPRPAMNVDIHYGEPDQIKTTTKKPCAKGHSQAVKASRCDPNVVEMPVHDGVQHDPPDPVTEFYDALMAPKTDSHGFRPVQGNVKSFSSTDLMNERAQKLESLPKMGSAAPKVEQKGKSRNGRTSASQSTRHEPAYPEGNKPRGVPPTISDTASGFAPRSSQVRQDGHAQNQFQNSQPIQPVTTSHQNPYMTNYAMYASGYHQGYPTQQYYGYPTQQHNHGQSYRRYPDLYQPYAQNRCWSAYGHDGFSCFSGYGYDQYQYGRYHSFQRSRQDYTRSRYRSRRHDDDEEYESFLRWKESKRSVPRQFECNSCCKPLNKKPSFRSKKDSRDDHHVAAKERRQRDTAEVISTASSPSQMSLDSYLEMMEVPCCTWPLQCW